MACVGRGVFLTTSVEDPDEQRNARNERDCPDFTPAPSSPGPLERSLPLTIQDAVDSLYEKAVVEAKATSTKRLDGLAGFCIRELAKRGLVGAVTEAKIPGGGRSKVWDVAWNLNSKYRLAISLKSLLKNLGGTVPNRVDDMIGEVANLQMQSPEIVIGYIMLFDIATDSHSARHGCTWAELLKRRINRLTGRRPPSWGTGMIEASSVISVDFSSGPTIVSGEEDLSPFFDRLVADVKERNPVLGDLSV